MTHPLHDFSGVDKKVNAVITYDPSQKSIRSAVVVLSVADFNSGNAARDAHSLEDLDAKKYPFIIFTGSKIQRNNNSLTISGTLNFHNVQREITFTALQQTEGDKILISGGFQVDMTQYKVKPPSLLGMAVNKLIQLKFHLEFTKPDKDFTFQ